MMIDIVIMYVGRRNDGGWRQNAAATRGDETLVGRDALGAPL